VARGLMTVVDVVVLGLLVAPERVAAYGIANKLPLFLASLAGLVHIALFPTVARPVFAGDGRRLGEIQGVALTALPGVALPGAPPAGGTRRRAGSVSGTTVGSHASRSEPASWSASGLRPPAHRGSRRSPPRSRPGSWPASSPTWPTSGGCGAPCGSRRRRTCC